MEAFWQDVRYGVRTLFNSPGFAVLAIATLALGIGANTALFSVVNAVLLEPLHFQEPNRLVALYEHKPQFVYASISYPNFLDWKRGNRSFESIAAFRPDDFSFTGAGEPQRLEGMMVSSDLFEVFGVKPLLGRTFDPKQDELGGRPEVMISEALWKSKFSTVANVVGRPMTLNGTEYTIVGVVPASFHMDMQNFHTHDVYVLIGQWNDVIFHERKVAMGMDAVARLKPGVTIQQARADMDNVTRTLAEEYPEANTTVGATVVFLKEKIVGEIRPFLIVLLAAVLFVLMIACVNVANLLLTRSMSRWREFAIRTALGASKPRVIRQLLTESVLLSLCGGAIGLILAAWGTQAALRLLPETLPRAEEIRLDPRVLVFTLVISVVAGIVFGLAPALKTFQPDLQGTLKEGGRTVSSARSRAQSVFVIVEMAMALVLLIGAGLMIRSLGRLWSVNPGFRPQNVLYFQVALPPSLAKMPADAIRADLRRLHDEIASVPGVSSLSMQRGGLPMYGDSEDAIWIVGQPKPARESDMPLALWYEVEPDYLKVMGIPLKSGRFFTEQDNENAPLVVVIDEDFAEKYFPHENPIGRSIVDQWVGKPAEIVGVVGHVRHWGLDDRINVHAQFYIPFMQIPDRFMSRAANSTGVLLRSDTERSLALLDPIRKKIESTNSEEVVFEPYTYETIISKSLSDRWFAMILLAAFAVLALVLASIGIYGVIAYLVGQRTHEIGIRIALGAQQRDVLQLVLGEGARTAMIGVTIGVVAALALTHLMTNVLYQVSATDPLTFFGVAAVLSLVALAACYIPARRAMRVDPIIALRHE